MSIILKSQVLVKRRLILGGILGSHARIFQDKKEILWKIFTLFGKT